MDNQSPDQYQPDTIEHRVEQAFDVLINQGKAVLAMTTGGCARYAFSADAPYCFDRRGYPLIHYSSANPHHHLIMTNSTMDMRMPHRTDADGNELSLLILTGMLRLVDPGDHDSIDRHVRHFGGIVENYSRGASRLYRFAPEKACFELFSGQRIPLPLEQLIRRNPFSEREEMQLIDHAHHCVATAGKRHNLSGDIVGADAFGLDATNQGGALSRLTFKHAVKDVSEATAAIEALFGQP